MPSAGRRPARSYYRGFLMKGDQIRAIIRMRPHDQQLLWTSILRQGYAVGIDRSTNSRVHRYVRFNTPLSQFLRNLPEHLTRLDRLDPATVREMQLRRALSDQLSRDEYVSRSRISDHYSWGLEDMREAFWDTFGVPETVRPRRRRRIYSHELEL